MLRYRLALSAFTLATAIGSLGLAPHLVHAGNVSVAGAAVGAVAGTDTSTAAALNTATPIKHLVVIFQENVSFDHYFATYPYAANPQGEPGFTAAPDTPTVNGLSESLLSHNPNQVNPFRFSRAQALTCDQDHGYTDEQKAFNGGLMNKFVQFTEGSASNSAQYCPNGAVMGYYDGNTVTAIWNYAQNFAMSDNSFGTTFGPSTPGALNLVAADAGGVVCGPSVSTYGVSPCTTASPAAGSTGTIVGDPDPYYDDCSKGGTADKSKTAAVTGPNIGDLLNRANVTWGWFQGGFDDCTARHPDVAYDNAVGINPATDPNTFTDYSPHHEPFQYFASTANPHHLRPTSVAMIGHTDQANHQYDLTDFWAAAASGNLPAVSFLKAPEYEDGHAGYSDPLDEQAFLVNTINRLQSLPSWKDSAVIISYDDSDGWYDHVMGPIINHSNTALDAACGDVTDGAPARCDVGPRLPYLVLSPYAKANFVDSHFTDQSSTTRFIEDNWLGGERISGQSFDNTAGSINAMFDFNQPPSGKERRLYLDEVTGEPVTGAAENGFVVNFSSANPGRGMVYFGTGPGCSGLVQVATQDEGAGTYPAFSARDRKRHAGNRRQHRCYARNNVLLRNGDRLSFRDGD